MSRRVHIPTQEIALPDLRLGNLKKTTSMKALKFMQGDLLERGLRAPLVVVPTEKGGFDVIDGYTRTLAARRIGWKKIICVVLPAGRSRGANEELAEVITKLSLGELADHELARKAIVLRDEHEIPAAKLADIIGRSRGSTCNLLRWWEAVPAEIQKAWQGDHPLVTHAELERYSKMSHEGARAEWKRRLTGADAGAAWSPGQKNPAARSGKPRNGEQAKLVLLDEAVEGSRLKPPVKSFVRRVLGFLMGRVRTIPGVTDRKQGIPKEIRE